ncbi:MAG: DUF177 domain-containing protein [Bacteroidetes bacterium]|nr:DUF177 domain-containing protein [Bacteroidota bacterium]
MLNNREYIIPFVGLKEGIHEFVYQIDEKFFAEREAFEFSKASANVKLLLDKHQGFLMLKFEIGGDVELSCDRCGNPLKVNLWDEFNIIVKLVDDPDVMNEQEDDPDIYYISRLESKIDVSTWIYEFILLSLPMQKTCSNDENGNSLCNPEVLKKLHDMEKQSEHNANSLWKGLDKFKNN